MRPVPKTIELFGATYTVKTAARESEALGEGKYWGRIYYDLREIYLSNDLTGVGKQETFMHEVCHALLTRGGLSDTLDPKTVEGICNCIGNGLRHFIFGGKK